ncbi:unnamed protein product [Litomosoides sigmodontis]|uniref:Uncharacterized protein n=1 Tax=Litomosoides sigmodontis TaxID=42156 RepID=A0A3P6V6K3_LITSI|nr:unnamed protein product [Litomosoides sigmodontis]
MPKTNILHLLAASDNPTALDAVQNLLETRQKRVNEREEEGLTALHVAAAWDNLAMCQLLMYFGADPLQEDDNGRTAKDMAKGSVKIFFERLYEIETPEKTRSVQQSFLRALDLLFSCSKKKTIKTPSRLNRSNSWSPSYDGTGNFLSKEEGRLRWAFRKNQPGHDLTLYISIIAVENEQLQINMSGFEGKKSSAKSSDLWLSSQQSTSSTMKLPKHETSDESYATAREYNTKDNCGLSCDQNSSNARVLSEEFESLKLDSTSPPAKGWTTQESLAKTSTVEIPAEILAIVRQLSDERLKQELAQRQVVCRTLRFIKGECVGPLLEVTRPAYELKLARLIANLPSSASQLKYSWALERWIDGSPFSEGPKLDQILINSFAEFSGEQWRGGSKPTSFCYVLIDPSIISLPSKSCTMQQFVDSIFYIGKGIRSRPFRHLVDAVRAKSFGDSVLSKSKKLQKIIGLWNAGYGVVSLHVFQNTIPTEAFTREAAMIDAIGIRNLTNVRRGDYYGPAKNWTTKEKTIYGSYLLSNALAVFHVEGCREIYEEDVQER